MTELGSNIAFDGNVEYWENSGFPIFKRVLDLQPHRKMLADLSYAPPRACAGFVAPSKDGD